MGPSEPSKSPLTVRLIAVSLFGKVSARLLGRSAISNSSSIEIDGETLLRNVLSGLAKIDVCWESLLEVVAKKLHGG